MKMNWSKYTYRLNRHNFWFNMNPEIIKVKLINKVGSMKSFK